MTRLSDGVFLTDASDEEDFDAVEGRLGPLSGTTVDADRCSLLSPGAVLIFLVTGLLLPAPDDAAEPVIGERFRAPSRTTTTRGRQTGSSLFGR